MALSICLRAAGSSIRSWRGLFLGLKAAVIALVIEALLRIGKRALTESPRHLGGGRSRSSPSRYCACPSRSSCSVPALAGFLRARFGWGHLPPRAQASRGAAAPPPVIDAGQLTRAHAFRKRHSNYSRCGCRSVVRARARLRVAGWEPQSTYTQLGVFFSKMAVVTFGGATPCSPTSRSRRWSASRWVHAARRCSTASGSRRSTPGPLIMVVQFVGFLGRLPDGRRRLIRCSPGVLGRRCSPSWVTFVPCFLWIFLGAPYIEALRSNVALSRALAAMHRRRGRRDRQSALWFASHVLFASLRTSRRLPTGHRCAWCRPC